MHCYAECHLCWLSLMLSVIYADCHLCWVSFMLTVTYAECHLCWLSLMLCVTYKPLCWVSSYWVSLPHFAANLDWKGSCTMLFFALKLLKMILKPPKTRIPLVHRHLYARTYIWKVYALSPHCKKTVKKIGGNFKKSVKHFIYSI